MTPQDIPAIVVVEELEAGPVEVRGLPAGGDRHAEGRQ